MARSGSTGVSRARDSRAVISVHPALGPSLGVAPATNTNHIQMLPSLYHQARHSEPTCHGEVWQHRRVQGQGEQGGDERASCAWSILGGGPSRHVHVDRCVLEEGGLGAKLLEGGPCIGVGYAGALLHHIAQLPCIISCMFRKGWMVLLR